MKLELRMGGQVTFYIPTGARCCAARDRVGSFTTCGGARCCAARLSDGSFTTCASGARAAAERAPNENWGLARRSNTTLCGFASIPRIPLCQRSRIGCRRPAMRGAVHNEYAIKLIDCTTAHNSLWAACPIVQQCAIYSRD